MSAIAQALDPTVIGSVALRKGPRSFWLHRSDRCRALMLTCQHSPLCQRCERCNNVLSSSWLPWLNQFNSVVITWRALIGTSCRLAAYNYTSSLALWTTPEYELADTNWGIQKVTVEPATRSAVATWLVTKFKSNKFRIDEIVRPAHFLQNKFTDSTTSTFNTKFERKHLG